MINEKLRTGLMGSLAQRLARVMFVKLPTWQLIALAAVVGAIWAASLFDLSFVTG